jgi:oligopeptidase A
MNNIELPEFNIDIQGIPEKLAQILNANRRELKQLLTQTKFTWDNLIHPLEMMQVRLHGFWSIVSHLNSVKNTPEFRKVFSPCLLKVNQYHTQLWHNSKLYRAVRFIYRTQFKTFTRAQQSVIKHYLLDFKLAGAHLSESDQSKLKKLSNELVSLQNKFSENLLDATHGWYKHVTNKAALAGMSEYAIGAAKDAAKVKKRKGFVLTLDVPCYLAVMTDAHSRTLREEMYTAFTTRASDQGPMPDRWDNTFIIQEILKKRFKFAGVLGFKQYASYSIASKMTTNTTQVLKFLKDLLKVSLPQAKEEFQHIQKIAAQDGIDTVQPWDIAYYSEILRKKYYCISEEILRPYFPVETVLHGLFKILKKLFFITFTPLSQVDVWHSSVLTYAVYDEKKKLRGVLYLDLYTRSEKRGGAWMDECRSRQILSPGHIQLPIAFVNCNFQPASRSKPALLSHGDVSTLFHEMGHALQHLLTTMQYSEISGINGIPWDAVEIASQFLENYVWQKSCLNLISKHYQTGKKLPKRLFNQLVKAKNFQSSMMMCRQLEFSLFDFRLHMTFNPKIKNHVQKILDDVRQKTSVTPCASFNRFQNGFSHIFSGGYAAGYYSYKWSEMMSADIFSLFERRGIFDRKTALLYRNAFLSKGASEDVLVLFKHLMKREPNVKALLRDLNIGCSSS